MTKWFIALCAVTVGGAFIVTDAEARRLGGARSLGMQRNVAVPPPARPAPQQGQKAAPAQHSAQQQAAAPGAPQPGAAGGSRWMPIVGGLAIGGMLGWLFAGNGLGAVLLLGLLALATVLLVRALAARRLALAPPRSMPYAGAGNGTFTAPPPSRAAGFNAPAAAPRAVNAPENFDSAAFLRAAKLNFVRLQMANDEGKIDEIREFATDEMFEALKADWQARGGEAQQTNVVTLNADLLEVTREGVQYWASVRFSGLVSEAAGAEPVDFEEVWNLVKPADGSSGWLLGGIQQLH
jgi:predicted lipid-binding transport protein (Tim44 family)